MGLDWRGLEAVAGLGCLKRLDREGNLWGVGGQDLTWDNPWQTNFPLPPFELIMFIVGSKLFSSSPLITAATFLCRLQVTTTNI